ncbi:MAG TPA: hypothetical protein VN843_24895, partial [Anaerolineales bacterium]|nr:hypothetical protein [Anaerolineales bacterium]
MTPSISSKRWYFFSNLFLIGIFILMAPTGGVSSPPTGEETGSNGPALESNLVATPTPLNTYDPVTEP